MDESRFTVLYQNHFWWKCCRLSSQLKTLWKQAVFQFEGIKALIQLFHVSIKLVKCLTDGLIQVMKIQSNATKKAEENGCVNEWTEHKHKVYSYSHWFKGYTSGPGYQSTNNLIITLIFLIIISVWVFCTTVCMPGYWLSFWLHTE